MRTFFIGDTDLAFEFDFDLVGVSSTAVIARGLVGDLSTDCCDCVRVCRLDCLRGLGFGVASGCCCGSVVVLAGELVVSISVG